MQTLTVKTGSSAYDILLCPGCASRAGDYLPLDRKVLVVTDDGVPEEYAARVLSCCRDGVLARVGQGEGSKSIETWQSLLSLMLEHGFTRSDCVVAVGGGVCGDLAGFAAASYMRGIPFYNIPTTLLSQVDSSIGGKTAVNFAGVKNIVGAFYPPARVLIDTDLLRSLPPRQFAAGLAEAIKMSLTSDAELFALIEQNPIDEILPTVIERSLRIKKAVVEQDEKEAGLRKILNFGHTIGHAIESAEGLGGLLHGECVALGMLPMCADGVRERLLPVLEKAGLPTACQADPAVLLTAMAHDKKADAHGVRAVWVPEVGKWELVSLTPAQLAEKCRRFAAR